MFLPAVYIPVKDLNSTARAPMQVSKKVIFTSVSFFSFRVLEHLSLEIL